LDIGSNITEEKVGLTWINSNRGSRTTLASIGLVGSSEAYRETEGDNSLVFE